MMVEIARQPNNLDNLMNEGIAIGKRPVMIGRRKPSYNTIDKVMKCLNLIMNVMS